MGTTTEKEGILTFLPDMKDSKFGAETQINPHCLAHEKKLNMCC